jgi:micrococcal nuclease
MLQLHPFRPYPFAPRRQRWTIGELVWKTSAVPRRTRAVVAAVLAAATLVAATSSRAALAPPLQGVVTRVTSGDAIDVRLTTKKIEHVRMLGVDSPDAGDCWASKARVATRGLALGKRVSLSGDAGAARRDGDNRLLVYVALASGQDLGLRLVQTGMAKLDASQGSFGRRTSYRTAQAGAKDTGLWTCATAPAPVPPVQPPPAIRDTSPPTTPALYTPPFSAGFGLPPNNAIYLDWRPSSDSVGVAGYTLYLNDVAVAQVPPSNGTPNFHYVFGNLYCGSSYTVAVEAFDAALNRSVQAVRNTFTFSCR